MTTPTAQPCISFTLSPPQLPVFFIPGISVTISPPIPPLPGLPCCKFTLPGFTFPITLPPLPLGAPLAALNLLLQVAFANLPAIQIPQCNF